MSFFYCLFEKYMRAPCFIWLFAIFLVISCVMVKTTEMVSQSETRQKRNIYHLANESVAVDGDMKEKDIKASELNARYALLMDASNGRVLFEKDGYQKVPMASTTKIMTLLITLENANLQDVVTVSDYAASMPDVQLNMKAGEQYILSDLLYSLMLESHNDTAVAIAEHVGGSVEEFAALMNEKAKEIGAYDTNFVTPNGLDAEGHYTTAYDLALLSSYAIKNETFLEIIQKTAHTFHEQTTGRSFTVNNKDRFLTSYEGAIGIKTGFTNDAGYCFVGAASRDDKTFVSVVLASGWPPNKNYKWNDTNKLMDYGMNHYHLKKILAGGTSFQEIPVLDSIEKGTIKPYVKDSVTLLVKEEDQISFDVKLPTQMIAPVKKDETVGEITIYVNDEKYKVLSLYSNENKSKITFGYILRKLCFRYFHVQAG